MTFTLVYEMPLTCSYSRRQMGKTWCVCQRVLGINDVDDKLSHIGTSRGPKRGLAPIGSPSPRCGDRLKIFCFSNGETSSPREVHTTLPSLYISPRHHSRPVLLLLSPSISCHLSLLSSQSTHPRYLPCPLFARLPPSPSLVLPPNL
jgi:hypothetical protein